MTNAIGQKLHCLSDHRPIPTIEEQRRRREALVPQFPDSMLLPTGVPVFLFQPQEVDGGFPRLFGIRCEILPGQVFTEAHLQPNYGHQVLHDMIKAGHARRVGKTSGLAGQSGGAGWFEWDSKFTEELDERVTRSDLLEASTWTEARPAYEDRKIHNRLGLEGATAGARIFEVCEGRHVLAVDRNTSPLEESALLTAGWLAGTDGRAEAVADEYLHDRALRQVGIYNERGKPSFKEGDIKEQPPKMVSLVPVEKIRGGLAEHAPVFRMLKDAGGFASGALTTSLPMDDFLPEDLRGTEAGMKAAVRRMLKERVAERVGKLEQDDRGMLHVVPCDADYFSNLQGFCGRNADHVDQRAREAEDAKRAEEVKKLEDAKRADPSKVRK